jgi:hypothetical protein
MTCARAGGNGEAILTVAGQAAGREVAGDGAIGRVLGAETGDVVSGTQGDLNGIGTEIKVLHKDDDGVGADIDKHLRDDQITALWSLLIGLREDRVGGEESDASESQREGSREAAKECGGRFQFHGWFR